MSNIKVTPNHAGLAVSESISFFTEQWKSTLQHSDFYIVAVVDEHGTVQTIHDFKAGNVALAEPAPGISLWLTLPFEVQGAIAGFMTHRWQDNAERVLQVALSDCEKLWIECSVRKVNLTEVDNHALWVMVRQVNDPRNRVLPAAEYGQKELVERFKYQMLELILQEPDTASALDKLAKSIENVFPNSNCAIVLTSTTGHSIETVIAPTLSQSLLTTLGQLVVESGNGSIATAIKTRKRVIIDDVNVHPYWENHRHLALEAGFRSVWSEPIITMQGIVLGAFGIFYQEHKVPDVNEISTIMHAANLVSIIVDRHLSQDKIQSLAYREPVTGLPNRRRVYDVFQNLKTQQMTGHYWGLIYIDIDHFKWINEAHGHVSGNALLLEMAERLQGVVVPHFLACMGGDEFLILLSGLNHDALKAQQQVNDLRVKIQKQCNKPFCFGNQKLTMTVSMGIAVFSDQDMREQDCIKAVDIAMHRAKQAGRNTVCVYEPGMQTEIASKVQLEVALREAIAKQQFCLHYQVQVDHTGKAFGAEALLRWQHPTLGMISPANFISVAESSGLIVDIGMWVIEQACMQLAKWQKVSKTSELTLSVNISARQFKQDNFSSMVKNCIQRYALNPNALRFELTESLLLENVDDAVRIMGQLSQLGIQFSLDDFGTGYSSLQYLKKLPLYQLKIDRSFVHDIVNDSHDRTIVRTIIAMAQSMYLSVIAEGVETREQMELLLNNGCRRYQGYYFGKPVPIEQFESQL